jgi:hypothetical protein
MISYLRYGSNITKASSNYIIGCLSDIPNRLPGKLWRALLVRDLTGIQRGRWGFEQHRQSPSSCIRKFQIIKDSFHKPQNFRGIHWHAFEKPIRISSENATEIIDVETKESEILRTEVIQCS